MSLNMAPVDLSLIENELKKLVKNDLINYIVYRTLPENVSVLSERAVKFLEEPNEVISQDKVTNSASESVCNNIKCIHIRADLRVAKVEVDTHKRIMLEMERSVENLHTIIDLLKDKAKCEVSPNTTHSKQTYVDMGAHNTRSQRGDKRALVDGFHQSSNAVSHHKNSREQQNASSIRNRTKNPHIISTTEDNKPVDKSTSKSKVPANSQVNNINRKNQNISSEHVSKAIMEAESHQIMNSLVSLGNDNQKNDSNRIRNELRDKRPRQTHSTTIGTGPNGILQAVPSFSYFHVYRLHPTVTEESLKKFLKSTFPEVICRSLDSKNPEEYSSFKVGVHENNSSKILNPVFWPVGTKINKFFQLKNIKQGVK